MARVFSKIIAGEIPSYKVYEDDMVMAFHDMDPQAPTHILVIPKAHIASASEIDESNSAVISHIFEVIAKIARDNGFENDFRVVNNCGARAGQTVHHLHFHLMSGREFTWPAG